MTSGEIYLASFPFGDVAAMKLRPVLLLTGPIGSEILAAYITSVVPNGLLASDLVLDPNLPEFTGTRLKVVSVVRLHKLATIHKTNIVRYLGRISPATEIEVANRLRSILRL